MQNLEWFHLRDNSIKKVLFTPQSHIKWGITVWTPESKIVQAVDVRTRYVSQWIWQKLYIFSSFKQQTTENCFTSKYQGSFSEFNLVYIVITSRISFTLIHLKQWFSKCGFWPRNLRITSELGKNANFQLHPRPTFSNLF